MYIFVNVDYSQLMQLLLPALSAGIIGLLLVYVCSKIIRKEQRNLGSSCDQQIVRVENCIINTLQRISSYE